MNKMDMRVVWFVAVLVAAASVFFSLFESQSLMFFGVLGAIGILSLFYFQPIAAVYGLVFFYPFLQWQVRFGSLNAPVADVIGVFLFLIFAMQSIAWMLGKKWRLTQDEYPAWQYMLAFLFVGLLSLSNVDDGVWSSFKFLIRPMAFFYLVYVLLPIRYITKMIQLKKMMDIIFAVGVLLALGGIYMMMISNVPFPYKRAVPFGFGGFYPLGANHNLLAEVLVGTLPIALAFFLAEKDLLKRNLILACAGLIAAVNFLTFSRAGWLGMITVTAVLLWLRFQDQIVKKYLKPAIALGAMALIPIALILYILSTTTIAQGSNLNRLKLAEIAVMLFKEHPLIGNGVGTYYTAVEQVRAYIIEYGSALDAHGIFFKVMAEMGSLGLIALIALLASLAWRLARGYYAVAHDEDSIFLAGLIASSAGMFVFELFNTSYYQGKLWIFVGLAFAGIRILKTRQKHS